MELSDAKRKQYKLAVGLRILTVVIAVCLGGLCIWASFIRRSIPFLTSDELWKALGIDLKQSNPLGTDAWTELMKGHRIFTVITALLAAGVLFLFTRVCVQIGKDNSFSEENATSFNIMAALSGCASVLYLVKGSLYVGRCFARGFERAGVMLLFIYGCTFAIFLICAFLCRSLSRLVHNAYEVKHENDLTI